MLDPKRVAARLGVSVWKVRRLIEAGELPAHRFGSMLRIAESDLEGFLCRTATRSRESTALSISLPNETADDSALLSALARRIKLAELRQPLLKNYPEDGT
jgi:excisionase family DNA binding protein